MISENSVRAIRDMAINDLEHTKKRDTTNLGDYNQACHFMEVLGLEHKISLLNLILEEDVPED
jgi:hypothetical protein